MSGRVRHVAGHILSTINICSKFQVSLAVPGGGFLKAFKEEALLTSRKSQGVSGNCR